MQGWRSIMHGSPQQGSSTRISAVAAQKNGLDLAWRLNGMPPPLILPVCLALFFPVTCSSTLNMAPAPPIMAPFSDMHQEAWLAAVSRR